MAFSPQTTSLSEASASLADGSLSAEELTRACLDSIAKRDGSVHAYLEVFDDALEQARTIDEQRAGGETLSALAGIPIAIKDNILIQGRHASAGSKMLEPYIAAYDAHVVERLRDAGAVFVGRTNMDEFAMGSSTEHSAYGPTRNPLDESRVPGGSSGGSAAALAYGGALGALGSDTGGSIRQPASFCGVAGLKPTYGTVSRRGLIAMGSSLDQIGPFGKTVEDTALLFDAIAGHDPRDGTSIPDSAAAKAKTPKRIGVPRGFLTEGVDTGILQAFETTLEGLSRAGYEVIDIELPSVKRSLATYYIIMPAEVSSNLARFDGVRYGLHHNGDSVLDEYERTRGAGFGAEVKRRIMLGTYVLSAGYYDAYYATATAVRSQILADFNTAFESVDVIATPTTPSAAFAIGEKHDPVSMYAADIFTTPANLTGLPALSVPSRPVLEGDTALPAGFQVMAPHRAEQALFAIGRDVERLAGA